MFPLRYPIVSLPYILFQLTVIKVMVKVSLVVGSDRQGCGFVLVMGAYVFSQQPSNNQFFHISNFRGYGRLSIFIKVNGHF